MAMGTMVSRRRISFLGCPYWTSSRLMRLRRAFQEKLNILGDVDGVISDCLTATKSVGYDEGVRLGGKSGKGARKNGFLNSLKRHLYHLNKWREHFVPVGAPWGGPLAFWLRAIEDSSFQSSKNGQPLTSSVGFQYLGCFNALHASWSRSTQ